MNAILRNTLTVAGLAAASPAFAWTVWPDVDFEGYANVGRPAVTLEAYPARGAGYASSVAFGRPTFAYHSKSTSGQTVHAKAGEATAMPATVSVLLRIAFIQCLQWILA